MITYKKLTLPILFFLLISFSANALELKIPKLGKKGDLKGAKLNFTKIFFESSINYLEAQYHLFNALEMNDEANKTKKSIDFVKDKKNKEGKRLTNAFTTSSENSTAIEGALIKEKSLSAEGKVHYAKSLPYAIKGLILMIELPPEANQLLQTIKADPTAALSMADFIKVLPEIPGYVSSAQKVVTLIVTGAKSREVEGADDATKALGEL
tara:strand:+ start:1227 stop:1856 length:630 start_codon:yes stop_codon:yes gene_type:complete